MKSLSSRASVADLSTKKTSFSKPLTCSFSTSRFL